MGSFVIQIACGRFDIPFIQFKIFSIQKLGLIKIKLIIKSFCRRHTVAYVPSTSSVHAYGLGGSGQLGNGSVKNALSPVLVKGPWSKKHLQRFDVTNGVHDSVVVNIFSGGAQNFVLTKDKKVYILFNVFFISFLFVCLFIFLMYFQDEFNLSHTSVPSTESQILCLKSGTVDTWMNYPEVSQIPDEILK